MRNTIILLGLALMLIQCRKTDIPDIYSEAKSTGKGQPMLSQVWQDGKLTQQYFYENGKLVRILAGYVDFRFEYRGVDHFVVKTGDYGWDKYYFDADHHLIRMDADSDDQGSVWVTRIFNWDKDRISWALHKVGDFTNGNYVAELFRYIYDDPWKFRVEDTVMTYRNNEVVERYPYPATQFTWHTPFKLVTGLPASPERIQIFSNTVRNPLYGFENYPAYYFDLKRLNKHDLMNVISTNATRANSGMLLMDDQLFSDGQMTERYYISNIKMAPGFYPASYDRYYEKAGQAYGPVHYEFRYVNL